MKITPSPVLSTLAASKIVLGIGTYAPLYFPHVSPENKNSFKKNSVK
jgi:hypothetical protein